MASHNQTAFTMQAKKDSNVSNAENTAWHATTKTFTAEDAEGAEEGKASKPRMTRTARISIYQRQKISSFQGTNFLPGRITNQRSLYPSNKDEQEKTSGVKNHGCKVE
ncbi:MAG: hypothetical protein DMG65_24310 [Candidatus Angelobacter sp. Gp1-AA117]|nr:MAG: hypothetical protein DMG65_24310 [Candidatus Angelobacter sp. Gp1-AA117]